MKQSKNILYWVLGLILCALGVSLCTKGNLGLSMIGAVPYILHVWLRDTWRWFSQGVAEYVWEGAVLLIMCCIIRRFRLKYLLSFGTAVLSGFAIDGWLLVLGGNGAYATLPARIIAFVAGMVITSLAIACFFRTRLPLQVYELAVTEIAARFSFNQNKIKLGFDIVMLALALTLSLLLTHKLTGIGVGTVIITFLNAPLIAFFGKMLDRIEKKAG